MSSVRDDVLCKPKKEKKKKEEVRLHAGEAAARLCDSNIGRRQSHGCRRASVRNREKKIKKYLLCETGITHSLCKSLGFSVYSWKKIVSLGQSEPRSVRKQLN